MRRAHLDEFAESLDRSTVEAVRAASALKTAQRRAALAEAFQDPETARAQAAAIKAEVLERLPELLVQLENSCCRHGVVVHRCLDAQDARQTILGIVRAATAPGSLVVKAKSMATEEIGLNGALEQAGYLPIETDLGEFVVQIDGDYPSHIVTPIIHKTRMEVGRSFERIGLGPYTEDPETLTLRARNHLRQAFRQAQVGVSGVNFAIAETGRLVLVENEGNNRFSTTAPRVHIAVMGIEKVLAREVDLPLFLRLLAGSATGQRATVYTHLISGPRRADEGDGPQEVHLVLLDNGRSRVREGPLRDILRCIRCGACLNVCPVYRRATGHGYAHVDSGPLGAVLAPALEGSSLHPDLARASTLCGACEEVCPVKIPIPDLLLRLRADLGPDPAMRNLALAASSPMRWRTSLKLLPLAGRIGAGPLAAWKLDREPPHRRGRPFRDWWRERGAQERVADLEPAVPAPEPKVNVKSSVRGWSLFESRLSQLGGRMAAFNELADLPGPVWVDDDALHLLPCDVAWTRASTPWEAAAGITLADHAIAELGGLVLSTGPGRRRLASLAPPMHVALVRRADIVESLAESPALWSDRTCVIVAGPSRTADIEGVLVRGVHGPGEVWVVLVD